MPLARGKNGGRIPLIEPSDIAQMRPFPETDVEPMEKLLRCSVIATQLH